MSDPLLEIHGLVKDYQSLRPLRIRNLVVETGAVLTLSGFDAPAAEIFVHLVTGAALPDEGDITLFGTNTRGISDADAWLRSLDGIGLISHRAVLIDALSVLQNVAMPLTLDVDPLDPAYQPAAEALAREVGIAASCWDHPLGRVDPELNLRVRVARAVAPSPRLLIAEHPSAALPRDAVPRVAGDVARIARTRGAALLTLTADPGWADAVSGEVLTLQPGTGELASGAAFMERFKRIWGGR
jgi:predicted ABC-type transport system involved in lysophospholipase L1 biosynthesis ATPase subunit